MTRLRFLLTLAVLATAAALPTRAAAQTLDPTGSYELDIQFGGQPLPIVMELKKDAQGNWTGTAGNPNVGVADVKSVEVISADEFKVVLVTPDGQAIEMALKVLPENKIEGSWTGMGDGSKVAGRKVG
jgi:hypothetical protein